MASRSSLPPLLLALRPVRKTMPAECCRGVTGAPTTVPRRHLACTVPLREDGVIHRADRPRWSATPPAMQAPVRSRKRDPRFEWTVKSDPQELDRMYIRLLGPGGDRMLTDEVKWLAVTHKSFDHGRRGYNDRLAFLGRRIVTLQASLAMISAASQHQSGVSSGGAEASLSDSSFAHPALEGVESLSHPALLDLLDKRRLAPLAMRCGLADVLRWLPKRPDNLLGSGEESVLTEALFAIVGAIALQKGGNEAAQVARDKILAPLGVTS